MAMGASSAAPRSSFLFDGPQIQSRLAGVKAGVQATVSQHTAATAAYSTTLKRREGVYTHMRKTFLAVAIALVFALGSLAPAIAATDKKMAKADSLYNQLGGKKGITKVVDDFVGNVANDGRINKFFADTAKDPKRLASFKGKLVDQICQASGGPCKYKGKDMKTAHRGMGISSDDFNALVEDLVKALDANNVSAEAKNALLGALGPMKGDIVEK